VATKGCGYLHQAPAVRYQFIQEHLGQFSARAMCRVMEVTHSGFYAWRTSMPSPRSESNEQLLCHIKEVHHASKQTYGSPRIHQELRTQGLRCGRHRIARLMRAHQIRAKGKRRFVVTTQSDHSQPVHENILDRQFTASAPNQRWASDITYLWTNEGWLYLAVVLDLFSRRVVGWSMQERMHTSLVSDALTMALAARRPSSGLLHHSDRGSQYASGSYQDQLQQHEITCSMSRKGNCWDNAVVESFFSTLKWELISDQSVGSRSEMRSSIFEYIEVWYNRKRRHSTLGYVSPAQFEQSYCEQNDLLAIAA